MEIFIRGLVALGAALAVATLGWSQYPQGAPTPGQPKAATAAPANGNCASCAAATDPGAGAGHHGLFGRLGIHLHPLPYHPAEPHGGFGMGHGGGPGGAYGGGLNGYGAGNGNGNGQFGHFDHSPFPTSQPGTVVFPQHPYARSPRDYFMAD
ncbi:MAG TPA: hypothetical protein VGZ47_13435 [Gemmataceae bacterium]|nr:hypothetical protein [Gemmataceae bacterium]